ncbi:MAG: hypothetical protein CVV59_01140 [Tenericutes bacterium HGW-Tenericutes-4]|jgi:uncharacterized repeat protein (TIGR02543 family)|nr:MAG: hypothetical protein CVV59_01140 [Tenericutes bacterium HGW-Tenericutes-4]
MKLINKINNKIIIVFALIMMLTTLPVLSACEFAKLPQLVTVNVYSYYDNAVDIVNQSGTTLINANNFVDVENKLEVKVGNTVTLVATSNVGYLFIGWYGSGHSSLISNDSAYSFIVATSETDNLHFYAHFELDPNVENYFTVTFNANNSFTNVEALAGSSFGEEIMPANPTRAGYNFIGWSTVSSAITINFTANTVITNNINVYAIWSISTYAINYNVSGGMAINNRNYNINSATITLAYTMKSGYTFDGWKVTAVTPNTVFKSVGVYAEVGDIITHVYAGSYGNLLLQAQWTLNEQ